MALMILGPDGKPVEVEPIAFAPPSDPYEDRVAAAGMLARAPPPGARFFEDIDRNGPVTFITYQPESRWVRFRRWLARLIWPGVNDE